MDEKRYHECDDDGVPLAFPGPGSSFMTKRHLREVMAQLQALLDDPDVWRQGKAQEQFDIITEKYFYTL